MTWNEFKEALTLFAFLICLMPVVFTIAYSIAVLIIYGGHSHEGRN